jgi:hypothetical protein
VLENRWRDTASDNSRELRARNPRLNFHQRKIKVAFSIKPAASADSSGAETETWHLKPNYYNQLFSLLES